MKRKSLFKYLILFVLVLILSCFLVACKDDIETDKDSNNDNYKVEFIVEGAVYSTLEVEKDKEIIMPPNPTKDGFEFKGWYYDNNEWNEPFNSTSLIENQLDKNLKVYAKWIEKEIANNNQEKNIGGNANDGLIYGYNSDGTVAVIGARSDIKQVIIPETVFGAKVTVINSNAFYSCDNLTSVTIPDSVTSIGFQAFYSCDNLASVTIPNNVTSIACGAFYCCGIKSVIWNAKNCTIVGRSQSIFYGCSITSVIIGENVKTIPSYAFYMCDKLTSLTISASVTSIGNDAFVDSHNLTRVNYLGTIDQWAMIDFGNDDSNPLFYATTLYINNWLVNKINLTTATKISDYAFKDCSGLTSVTIGNSVANIGNNAFYKCSGIVSVNYLGTIDQWAMIDFDNGDSNPLYYAKNLYINSELVTEVNLITASKISNYAFKGCSSLVSITIPDSVTNMEEEAFYDCTGLTSITIPNSVTSIGSEAFYKCSSLIKVNYLGTIDQWAMIDFDNRDSNPLYYAENLYINNELVTEVNLTTATEISCYAFGGCSSLTSITIPSSVTSIGKCAFCGCSGLTDVTIPNSVTSIGDSAFDSCSGLTSIKLPDSVVNIGQMVFCRCSSLVSITIPDSVISIGDYAFCGCSGLTNVTIPDSVTSMGKYAFGGTYGLTINCEVESKPYGWSANWADSNTTINWGQSNK